MAEEDEGMEAFDFDERDLEFALNPGRRHFQTKNQATYGGVFGQIGKRVMRRTPTQDLRLVRDPKRLLHSRKKAKKDYSAPINFISGGIKQGSSLEPPDKVKKEEKDDTPIEITFKKERKRRTAGANVFAGMRTSAVKGTVDPNVFGDWTKFGKGDVVKKMMKAMGYKEGEGLGASQQGIVEPVQATVRKGRGAIGAYGKEAAGPKFGESAADAQRRLGDQREPAQVKTRYKTLDEVIEEGGSIGFRSSVKTGVKVIDMTGPEQRVYSGYDSFSMKSRPVFNDISDRENFDVPELMHNLNLLVDLTEESIRRNDSQLKSIKDRTTALEYDLKQAKEMLDHEEKATERIKEVYELIEKFSKRKGDEAPSINDCQALFTKLRAEYKEEYHMFNIEALADRTTALEYDLKQAKEMLDHEEKATERIKEVYELIEKFSKRKGDEAPSINDCQALFTKLRTEYKEEYHMFNIEALAVPLVLPQILEYFSKWRPLDPDHLIYGVDLMKEWRDILVDGENTSMFTDRLSAYDRLLWEGWLPSLRRASLDWDPRDHMEPMLRIIEMWLPVIIPRIDDRVSSWDPLTDSVPIHSWLVPWLAVLGDRLQPVLAPIRQKLAKALRLWNPTDHSAMAILKPWCGVWTPATMSAFLAQNVVPKLEKCLDTMNLNPRENKKYEEWYACMSWMGMISPDTMASIVTKYFFPRWYAALCHWLDSPRVILNEVKLWYREWDQRIPPQIRDFPTIKENLRRGMVALMESSQGLRVSSGPPPPPLAQAVPPPPPPVAMRPSMGVPMNSHMSLKEVLERMAAQHDLTHIPQRDRLKEGRQVYWFGTQSIYLDRNIVYVLDTQTFSWRPVGMEELLQLAGVK
ncbi:g-patch domain protein [Ancylostoma ceylanicum]|uniref:G-patch domain protein n=1 Tax=Ancylostoma ceylanicum TaxID=53326 RepID=A0A0D6L6Y1_9BILA|nr:g-patch domain protein [Ancylostoma ceylanicum]